MSEHDSEDRIFLRGLTTECIIGFVDWERRAPQTVVIDLELPCDCERAARRDVVADTVDYKTVAKRVLGWVQASQFQLVESLAHGLALLLLAEFPLDWVRACPPAIAIRRSDSRGRISTMPWPASAPRCRCTRCCHRCTRSRRSAA